MTQLKLWEPARFDLLAKILAEPRKGYVWQDSGWSGITLLPIGRA